MSSRRYESQRQRDRWEKSRGPRLSAASLVLIGLIVGFIASIYYAWLVEPVVYTEASPARMSDRHKAEYILLVSQSYEADGNWERVQDRLAALNDPDIQQTVATLLEDFLRQGQPAPVMQSLATLAGRLGVESAAIAVFAPQPTPTLAIVQTAPAVPLAAVDTPVAPATQLPTSTPSPTLTPTSIPSPTVLPVFRLLRQQRICDPAEPAPRIEVIAVDSSLEPLPGAEVIVLWDGGSDHFFTGFKPEKGLGYGDFTMSPDVVYQVMMVEGSQAVTDLRIEPCDEVAGGLAGGWRLTFQNIDVVQDSDRS